MDSPNPSISSPDSASSQPGPGLPSSRPQSFVESLRTVPPSPRSQRHPSFTQAALQELLNHPPVPAKQADPRFAGRDWREISIGELMPKGDTAWVNMTNSVEEATTALVKSHPLNCVLVRDETREGISSVSTFDYSDLNMYLLAVVRLAKPPDASQAALCDEIAKRATTGPSILLGEIQDLCAKEELVPLSSTDNLARAMKVLGSGIHRALVVHQNNVVGLLTQSRLIDFFWSEGVNFPAIDVLYSRTLRDLGAGSQHVLSVNCESPLSDALMLMNVEGLTSVAVIDNGGNVVGNISIVDVKHVTTASQARLLQSTCMHFISVILSERGMEKGRDTFPVFYVNLHSTLAHTVAKLAATQSHRMWVVESASPSPTQPSAHAGGLSGKLTGVVSLTDILNVFAKSSGLDPADPGDQRARRRRSSSISVLPKLTS